MQIVTNSGKTFDADWTLDTVTRHGAHQLTIQLPGDTALKKIMGGLVGCAQITSIKESDVRTVYEGYTRLASLIYSTDRKALRLTLERDDEA